MKVSKAEAVLWVAVMTGALVQADEIRIRHSDVLPAETAEAKAARMAWWTEARFGMFIHFGLYAMPARNEWVRYVERTPNDAYDEKYFKHFNPTLLDVKSWVESAKRAGMKYVVLTTKHHEGFCLWDSKVTDYKITNTPFGRDLVREFVDACRVAGLRPGFYYSLLDWHHPDYTVDATHPLRTDDKLKLAELNKNRDMAKYRKYMFDQVTELLTDYGKVDLLFYDFTDPGINGKTAADWDAENLLALTRRLQPGIIVNDRLGIKDVENGWDFKAPEQIMPAKWVEYNGKRVPWEACQTFSGSWGYHRNESTWKSPEQLIDLLISSCSKGGNVILNVGPTARGEFDRRARQRLDALGEWMRLNGDSIYGCTQAPEEFKTPDGCVLTYNPKANRLYVHIYKYPVSVLPIAFAEKVAYAQFLHDGSEIKISVPLDVAQRPRTDVSASLELPVAKPDVAFPVVEMFLK